MRRDDGKDEGSKEGGDGGEKEGATTKGVWKEEGNKSAKGVEGEWRGRGSREDSFGSDD